MQPCIDYDCVARRGRYRLHKKGSLVSFETGARLLSDDGGFGAGSGANWNNQSNAALRKSYQVSLRSRNDVTHLYRPGYSILGRDKLLMQQGNVPLRREPRFDFEFRAVQSITWGNPPHFTQK